MKIRKLLFMGMLLWGAMGVLKAQQSSLYEKQRFVQGKDTLLYRIMYPKDFDKEKQYPVILFLHGSGERGNDNEAQLVHGGSLFANNKIRNFFPAIVVFPQCPKEDYWSRVAVDTTTNPLGLKFQYDKEPTVPMKLVMSLLDETLGKPYTKTDQVYVMGLSMGGMGTFEIIYRKPDIFAAAVPICGGGDPDSVKKYAKKIPLWVFHGAQDNVVDPMLSLNMVSALLKEGAFPRFTLFDYANHNSWDPAFAEPDLLPWLFSHQKNKSQ